MGSQNPSIKALVKLIDDPDEDIFHHVRDELIKCGAKPFLILKNPGKTTIMVWFSE